MKGFLSYLNPTYLPTFIDAYLNKHFYALSYGEKYNASNYGSVGCGFIFHVALSP